MDRLIFKLIDFDLAERIIASGPVKRKKLPKTTRSPHPARSYRAARRNEYRGSVWPGAQPNGRWPFYYSTTLNRSQHWKHAKTYQSARDLSPSSEPVR